jgi:hypothetical protein
MNNSAKRQKKPLTCLTANFPLKSKQPSATRSIGTEKKHHKITTGPAAPLLLFIEL